MGVGRCCCKEEPPVEVGVFCRAWNSETNQEFNNCPPLSGTIPSGRQYFSPTNATVTDPNSYSFEVTSNTSGGGTALSYSLASQNPGFLSEVTGVNNGLIARSNYTYGFRMGQQLEVTPQTANVNNPPLIDYISRFSNQVSFPEEGFRTLLPAVVKDRVPWSMDFTLNQFSPSTERDPSYPISNILSGYTSWSQVSFFKEFHLRYYSVSPTKQLGVWYIEADQHGALYGSHKLLDSLGNPIFKPLIFSFKFTV